MTFYLLDMLMGGVKRAGMWDGPWNAVAWWYPGPIHRGLILPWAIERRVLPLLGVAGFWNGQENFLPIMEGNNNKTKNNRCDFFEQIFILGKSCLASYGT